MAERQNMPLAHLTREKLEPIWSRRDIPIERIAKALGVTRAAVGHKARRMGLPSRAGNQVPNQKSDDELFRRLWLAGVSAKEIARTFGYWDDSAVTQRRRRLGLPPRKRGNGNVGGWHGTISLAQFHEIEIARAMQAATGKEAR